MSVGVSGFRAGPAQGHMSLEGEGSNESWFAVKREEEVLFLL